jgi:16S rRNA (adenine(1408)-N(1))-methyltransferase
MRVVRGKNVVEIDRASFEEMRARYARVLVDVGAGDGRFAYDEARNDPELLAIAIDPVAEAMAERSSRAMRKPAKGGAPNALFVVAALESLPPELERIADRVTVNYPWGSLLEAVLGLHPELLERLASLARHGAELLLLLNASIFEDPAYLSRLDLPMVDVEYVERHISTLFASKGIVLGKHEFFEGDPPHRTSWGRHLVRSSGRKTLLLSATVT